MKNGFSRFKAFTLFAAFLAAVLTAGVASAIGPAWMPGFPLRAGTAVIVMWTPVPGATEYRLLKKMGEGDFKEVYKGAVNTFNDVDAPATKTIIYKAIAVIGGKDSDPSPPGELKGVEPLKPPVFTGTLPSADAITLRWSNPPGSMFFNLYRAEAKDGPFELLGSFQQDTHTDRKVAKGKDYFYKVSAIDRNNTESEKSDLVSSKLVVATSMAADKPVIVKAVTKPAFLGEELYELAQPVGIGFNKKGELYVADRIGLQFFDKDGNFTRRTDYPKGSSVPSGVILDTDGNFLVPFYSEQTVRKMDEQGKILWAAKYPSLPDKQNNPNFIIPDPAKDTYWISDGVRFQLLRGVREDAGFKIDKVVGRVSGSYSFQTKETDDLPGLAKTLRNPADGNLYALIGPEIKVIDPKSGKVVKTLGGKGLSNTKFQGIGDLVFLKSGHILVLDVMQNIIKEFDKDFEYICTYATIVEPGKIKLDTNYPSSLAFNEEIRRAYIPSAVLNKVFVFDLPPAPAAAK